MGSGNTSIPQRHRDLFFETLQLLRKEVTPRFYDWRDADDWLFSELGFTKSELAEIFAGRGVFYCDASAIDDKTPQSLCKSLEEKAGSFIPARENAAYGSPLSQEELVERGGRPVWAILLYPNVDADIPRPHGWGIVPEKDSFRQVLHQDFTLTPCYMKTYGKVWIAFADEQDIDRYEAGEGSE